MLNEINMLDFFELPPPVAITMRACAPVGVSPTTATRMPGGAWMFTPVGASSAPA
jgi:hypothetical protein